MLRDTKLTKSIGEHHVCAELARHGWATALTRDGLARTDILAVRVDDRRTMLEIQVKTTAHSTDAKKISWPLGSKSQLPAVGPREWFVLVAVSLDLSVPPRSFVIPRDHLAAAAWVGHMTWLTADGIPEGRRNVGPDRARIDLAIFARYEGRWDLLELDHTDDVPVLLPAWMRRQAQSDRVGLPKAHPWLDELPVW